MGCIEHACTNMQCGWIDIDNDSGNPACPVCGSHTVAHFDEEYDKGYIDWWEDDDACEPEADDEEC